MHKKIAAFAMTIGMALPAAIPAFAQTVDVTSSASASSSSQTQNTASEDKTARRETMRQERDQIREQREQLIQDRQNQREALSQQRCKNVESRIDTRINRYQNNKQMYENVFGNMLARLQRLSARLKSQNADTSKLDADITTLQGKIDQLFKDSDAFIVSLQDTKQLTCGQSQGDFAGKLGEARKQIPVVIQDRIAIRDFFANTIRPDLLAIRQTLDTQKPADTQGTAQEKPEANDQD